jgi:hypothetical protein
MRRVAFASLLVFLLLPRLGRGQSWSGIGPGVDVAQWDAGGPRRVSAARINLCQPGVRLHATTSDGRGKATSTWGASSGMLVAINSGFFIMDGSFRPHGIAGGGGGQWSDSAVSAAVGWAAFGRRKVEFFDNGGGRGWESWMEGAASASHVLLSGGSNVAPAGDAFSDTGHPRTAVGLGNRGRTMYFVVVDGRSSSSIGAPLRDLAAIMQGMGATEAINLDGGGSSTFWDAAHGVWNRPSGGSQRTVANHLGVTASGAGDAYHCPDGRKFELQGLLGAEGTTVTGEIETVVKSGVRLKNTGTLTWGANSRLAPLPRDRANLFAASDWLSPTRIAAPPKAVPEGATVDLPFSWKMPAEPGTYRVPLTMVEEGVEWFGDSWGPPDGSQVVTLQVLPKPSLRAQLLRVEPASPIVLAPGEELRLRVDLLNTGGDAWPDEEVWLTPTEPRGRTSPFEHSSWWSSTLVASFVEMPTGDASHAMTFRVKAPLEVGDYTEHFGLVTSDGRWFSESGGPVDGAIRLEIEVREGGASAPDPDAPSDDSLSTLDGRGCECATGSAQLLMLASALLFLRRRR